MLPIAAIKPHTEPTLILHAVCHVDENTPAEVLGHKFRVFIFVDKHNEFSTTETQLGARRTPINTTRLPPCRILGMSR